MTVRRLNHAVLYVRDARRSAAFYREALDFEVVTDVGNGAGVFMTSPPCATGCRASARSWARATTV